MDDKIIDDLDPDFINDILGSSELAENLIEDLMSGFNTSNNLSNNLNNNLNNNVNIIGNNCQLNASVVAHHQQPTESIGNNYPISQLDHNSNTNYSEPYSLPVDCNQPHFGYVYGNNHNGLSAVHGMENPTNVVYNQSAGNYEYVQNQSVSQSVQVNQQPQAQKRVKKNLKDILAGDSSPSGAMFLLNPIVDSANKFAPAYTNCGNSTSVRADPNTVRADVINISPVLSPNCVQAQHLPQSPPLAVHQLQVIDAAKIPILNEVINQNTTTSQSTAGAGFFIDQTSIEDKILQINSSNIKIVLDANNLQNTPTFGTPCVATSVRKVPSFSSLPSQDSASCKPSTPVPSLSSPAPTMSNESSNSNDSFDKENQTRKQMRAPKSKTAAATFKANLKVANESGGRIKLEDLNGDEFVISGKKKKQPKRTSHNAIEKKYRSSINDKIIELKNRVAGSDIKLQKSGILRKALEYINNIEDRVKHLAEENQKLRSALTTISLNVHNPMVIESVLKTANVQNPYMDAMFIINSPSPSVSNSSSPNSNTTDGDTLFSSIDSDSTTSGQSSPKPLKSTANMKRTTSGSGGEPSTKRTYKKTKKNEGVMDGPKVILCMVVMSVMFFNPFNLLLSGESGNRSPMLVSPGSGSERHIVGRVLNSLNDYRAGLNDSVHATSGNYSADSYFKFMFSWTLNVTFVLVCLLIAYLKDEPASAVDAAEHDKTSDLIWFNYQQSGKQFARNNYESAFDYCQLALTRQLGKSVPRGKFQLVIGITWQSMRFLLDRLYVGKLLFQFVYWLKSPAAKQHHLAAYKSCALFYYELQKFSYLNMKCERDFTMKTSSAADCSNIQLTTYSSLAGIYYTLAMYNMCEMYTSVGGSLNHGEEFNLCEFYLSMVLFLKFYLPSWLSNRAVAYLLGEKLATCTWDDNDDADRIQASTKHKLIRFKRLLRRSVFMDYVTNFENMTVVNERESSSSRRKLINLISYKRRLFTSSFLYDADTKSQNGAENTLDVNAVACDFLVSKFKDYVLLKMTNHIVNQSGTVTVDKLLAARAHGEQNEHDERDDGGDVQEIELADVDQRKFERLRTLYKQHLDYLMCARASASSQLQQETHTTLLMLLDLLNNWKLRKFNYKLQPKAENIKNTAQSSFVDSIVNIFKAYEVMFEQPKLALHYIKTSLKMIDSFNSKSNSNSLFIEKFELLIYDWLLSAQAHLWSKSKLHDLELFNKSLNNFKNLAVNYPQLHYKAKMYETILMYSSNRNPINLLSPTKMQHVYSKSNQDAFFSISSILKKFQLQLIE